MTNIWGLHSNFVDCESFLESNFLGTLALCETNLDDSNNFPVRGYLPLIQEEGLPLARDLSLENCAGSYTCFWLALLHSLSYFFFLYWSSSLFLCMVFDSISSKIDEVLSINPSAVFVFGDFNVHHKYWLTYSGGTDRSGEVCYNFSISNDFTQMVNLLGYRNVIVTVLLFWIYFFLLMLGFVLQWLSLHCEILIMLLPQFLLTFHQICNGVTCFIA